MATHYHSGELAVQRRMGQADIAIRLERIIRPDISESMKVFLTQQPVVFVAARDDEGRMWASQIIGVPGFVHALDARTIAVDEDPAAGDPLAAALRTRRRIGMLALQPQLRRRVRVNGTAEPREHGLVVKTDQVYSNCPKYIARRDIEAIESGLPDAARRSAGLDDRQRQAIGLADTFIVGTADLDGNADASHRGGNPGFLQVLSPTRLRWPDYVGNSMFMTLGNIQVDHRCGLLIPDWHSGSTLQLTGTAEINWDQTTFAPGAQCSIDFDITEVVEITNASPLRWGDAEPSPVNPPL